jgi:nondiscriminating glutamyl-tRNA synthetase
MLPDPAPESAAAAANPFTAADVATILRERGWFAGQPSAEQVVWCERAALLLGPHCADRGGLESCLTLVFHYDARAILTQVESHAVLARTGARDVLRQLALLVLEGDALDSDRFKVIVTTLKEQLGLGGRELFHPIRLALAGRAGEGDLDRVILLLDTAAPLAFSVRVKGARERILEFCTALD